MNAKPAPPSRKAATATPPMASPTLAVFGHTNLDIQLQVRELPKPGQSEPVLERRTVWGGTACNIARHAAGLGLPVRLWSRVGDDFPATWRDAIEADGIDLSRFDVRKGGRTPTCTIVTDALERQCYLMDQGAMGSLREEPVEPSALDGLAKEAWVHVATGPPVGYAWVLDEARKRGHPIALDPGQELRFQYDKRSLEGALRFAQVLFVNDDELKVACDLLGLAGAQELLGLVESVVVTHGSRGASLHRPGRPPHREPSLPAKVVDPTGAGDAFRAGWHAATAAGRRPEESLRWGNAAAAAVIQHPGGQDHVVRPAELRALLA